MNFKTRGFTPSSGFSSQPSRYDIAELMETLQRLQSEIIPALSNMQKQLYELKLTQNVNVLQKTVFTIEEVTALFDISARLQQDERSAGRLQYLKKVDGSKILYRREHIKQYLNTYYKEYKINNPNPKP